VLNVFAADASSAWGRSDPQFLGNRSFLSVTDTSSAARYGVQTARLSRAGDNGPDRIFVGPTQQGLRAGVDSMKPRDTPSVREPAILEQPAGAYPLTTLTYAAIAPLALDAEARSDYARFVEFAATDGQTPGTELGNLPAGYLPLPESYTQQALAAADQIETMQPTPAPTPAPAPVPAPAPAASPQPSTTSTRTTTVQRAPRSATPTTTVAGAAPVPDSTVAEGTVVVEEAPVVDEVEVESTTVSAPTPSQSTGPGRYATPIVSGVALLSALAALELTKRPRRIPSDGELPGRATAAGGPT
jgi:hypothetical protein